MMRSDGQEHERYAERLAMLESRSVIDGRQQFKKRARGLKRDLTSLQRYRLKSNLSRTLALVIPFTLVLLVMVYVVSPLSKLTRVQVVGNQGLSVHEVESASGIKPGAFIWRVLDQQAVIAHGAQRKNPQLKDLRVTMTGPRAVRVTVQEYPVIGLANHNGRQELLLGNGKYRPVTGRRVANFVTYAGFRHQPQLLKTTAKQVGRLPLMVRQGISEVTYSPTTVDHQRLRLYMNDGNTVYVKADQLAKKLAYYPSITANMKQNGVVDLQFGAYSYDYGQKDH